MSKTKKEIFRFIISGICAVATDLIFYYILSNFVELTIAKGLSFLIGTVTAYLMNKYFTFEQKKKSLKEVIKFFTLYIISFISNITVHKISLIILPMLFQYIPFLDEYQIIKLFAFLFATGTSTIINFIGQKFWVFRVKNEGEINE